MKKHKLNFYPEINGEAFDELKADIGRNGFDPARPVIIYQGEILDGWNRQRACDDLGIRPAYQAFFGDDSAALEFVISTNNRRDLNKGQRGVLAGKAEDLMRMIAADAKERQKRKPVESVTQKIVEVPRSEKETSHKLGEVFGVNRTYVNQGRKLVEQAPEIAAKVEAGTMTMQDGMKELRKQPTNPWLEDEKDRQTSVAAGNSVIANAERDKNLIQWAETKGLTIRIDRGSRYGNPFVMDHDGDRDVVCDSYENHYLPHKPSIHRNKRELIGKVLICHCYPNRCHGEALLKIIKQSL